MTLGQVVVDGLGPGVEAVAGQLLVQGHDLVPEPVGDLGGGPMGPPGAGGQTLGPLEAIATQQLEEPAGADLVRRRQLFDRSPGPQVRLDQESAHVHRSTPPLGGLLCLDTSVRPAVSYVLNPVTVGGATKVQVGIGDNGPRNATKLGSE